MSDLIRPASSPCLACDIAAEARQTALDVARWRQAERARLLGERRSMSAQRLAEVSAALGSAMVAALDARFPDRRGLILSGFWPIKGEPDLRAPLATLIRDGVILALPVVARPKAPLIFRPWVPGMAMRRGIWNIPEPDTEATIWPDAALAPVVGWTSDGYRLGYGGGYFDRTLADAKTRPYTLGVGLASAQLDTIFPQPHDIPLDLILTETGAAGCVGKF